MKKTLILLSFLVSISAFGQIPALNNLVGSNPPNSALIKRALDGSKSFTASGTNTYTVATGLGMYNGVATYADGDMFTLLVPNANSSGTVSLNVDTEGAVAVKDQAGNDLAIGDLKAGGTYTFRHNGTHFRVINIGSSGAGVVTSVSGTLNRITSTGGVTPVIDVSATFEALLAKVAQRIDQNNAATTSAQLATTLTDENGTGTVVYSNSPTLTTPALGTPSAVVLTNATGLPGTSVINTPAGNIASTTGQAAINELDNEKANLIGAYTASGTNNYTVTVPGITSYVSGQTFDIRIPNTNTTAANVNVNGLGNLSLRKHAGILLSSGDLVPNGYYRVTYNGSYLQIVNSEVTERVYNVAAYGAYPDDAIDDTNQIQQAMLEAVTRGGGTVYFPRGEYTISGPLQTNINSVNPNCQLYIPLSTTDHIILKLRGEVPPNYNDGPLAHSDVSKKHEGVILHSTITGSGTLPAVLGGAFAFDGFANSNFVSPVIENIGIMVYTNGDTSPVAPTMTAFNLKYNQWKQLDNCQAFTETSVYASIEPIATTTFGFYLSESSLSDCYSNYGVLTAAGFTVGVQLSEHDHFDRIIVTGNYHGVRIGVVTASPKHPVFGGVIHNFGNKYGVTLIGTNTIVNFDYYAEKYPSSLRAVWNNHTADIYIPSSVRIDGIIRGNSEISGPTHTQMVVVGTYTGTLWVHDLRFPEHSFANGKITQEKDAGNAGYQNTIKNTNAGTSAFAAVIAQNSANKIAELGVTNSTYTPTSFLTGGFIYTDAPAGFNVMLADAGTPNFKIGFGATPTTRLTLTTAGRMFVGGATTPTAILHLPAGTTTANTGPIKLTEGVNPTTPEDGIVNYVGDNVTFTETSTVYTLAKTLVNTATLDFPSTAAQTSADLTITVTGATTGMPVAVSYPVSPDANTSYTAWVSATNTVTVRFNNYSSGAVDPASTTFRAAVIKY